MTLYQILKTSRLTSNKSTADHCIAVCKLSRINIELNNIHYAISGKSRAI